MGLFNVGELTRDSVDANYATTASDEKIIKLIILIWM